MNSFSKSRLKERRNSTLLVLACLIFFLAYLPATAAQSAQDNYGHKCAICHGQDGLGNTAKGKKVHVKDVHANMKDSEADMIKIVTDGKGDDMDSYKTEFTAAQIKDLVDYYRSLGQK
jgi:mono/diheme cytochrome c family protein